MVDNRSRIRASFDSGPCFARSCCHRMRVLESVLCFSGAIRFCFLCSHTRFCKDLVGHATARAGSEAFAAFEKELPECKEYFIKGVDRNVGYLKIDERSAV